MYSTNYVKNMGLSYKDKNTLYCVDCNIEISIYNWHSNISLYRYHKTRSPECTFIRKNKKSFRIPKIKRFKELILVKKYRESQFSKKSVEHDSIIKSGFIHTDIGDRLICIYCNFLAYNWNDDKTYEEVHKQYKPNCPYVKYIMPINKISIIHPAKINMFFDPMTTNNYKYSMLDVRLDSYKDTDWLVKAPKIIDKLCETGFYCIDKNAYVKCFSCGLLLKINDITLVENPYVIHLLYNSECGYIKNLYGIAIYNRYRIKSFSLYNRDMFHVDPSYLTSNMYLPLINRLSRKLNMSKNNILKIYITQIYKHGKDFKNIIDIVISSIIISKQIKTIKGNMKNIVDLQENNNDTFNGQICRYNLDVINFTTEIPCPYSRKPIDFNRMILNDKEVNDNNMCVICIKNEKCLACIPCGHVSACVTCSYALKSCPYCRKDIKNFLRVFI